MQGPSAVTPACQRRHKRKQAAAAGRRQAVGQLGSRITYIVSARNIRRGISPAHRVAAWGHRLVALSAGASGWRGEHTPCSPPQSQIAGRSIWREKEER